MNIDEKIEWLPCKRIFVEYTTFARKETYCVRIVQLFCVSDLLCTYTTSALGATCAYDVRMCAQSDLMRTYSTAFARKRLMRLKRLVRTTYDFFA